MIIFKSIAIKLVDLRLMLSAKKAPADCDAAL